MNNGPSSVIPQGWMEFVAKSAQRAPLGPEDPLDLLVDRVAWAARY